MSKKIIQDIIRIRREKTDDNEEKYFVSGPKGGWTRKNKRISKAKIIFAALFFVFFVVLGVNIVRIFAKAVVEITPHQKQIKLDLVLNGGISKNAVVPIEIMELKDAKEESVKATGKKQVKIKASGKIVVFNEFSSSPQVLIANTRFEAPGGEIYRIDKRITIPGAKVENGRMVPGSMETIVYADKPGEKYNIGLVDFTIPGFKGGPRYEKFYARSKTPLSGGFEGEKTFITESDFALKKTELEKNIKSELLAKIKASKPEEFLFYPNAFKINFIEDEANPKPGDLGESFTLKETGKMVVFLVSKKSLSDYLVEKYLGGDYKNRVDVVNLDRLKFELIDYKKDDQVIQFRLFGEGNFVWLIDKDELKRALLASPFKDLKNVFSADPAIDAAKIVFKPSWWKFFPKTGSKIEIKVVY
jgi:hypothetical protein